MTEPLRKLCFPRSKLPPWNATLTFSKLIGILWKLKLTLWNANITLWNSNFMLWNSNHTRWKSAVVVEHGVLPVNPLIYSPINPAVF